MLEGKSASLKAKQSEVAALAISIAHVHNAKYWSFPKCAEQAHSGQTLCPEFWNRGAIAKKTVFKDAKQNASPASRSPKPLGLNLQLGLRFRQKPEVRGNALACPSCPPTSPPPKQDRGTRRAWFCWRRECTIVSPMCCLLHLRSTVSLC